MSSSDDTYQKLLTENADLRTRLEEAVDTLRAIREGEVDALVVSGPAGEQIYTLKGGNYAYRVLVETISEGTVTLSPDGDILYANQQMATMLGRPLEQIIGSTIFSFIPPNDLGNFHTLLSHARKGVGRGEIFLKKGDGSLVPTILSCRDLRLEEVPGAVCLVAMNLAGLKETETALKESEQKLRGLTSQLLNAQESERRRIARDLHDDMGQVMVLLKLQLRILEGKVPAELSEAHKIIGEFRKHITEVIDNIHRLSHDLIPPILENLGLSNAVKSLLERFAIYQAAEVMMEIDDLTGLFPREVEINLFRLFQEFLNNIIKHANATQIKVIISRHPNCVDFRLEDNGKGFDPKTVLDYKNPGRGMGLVTMEERVHMLGGVLKLQSEPGQGTRIHFAVPVANPKKGASPLTSILT